MSAPGIDKDNGGHILGTYTISPQIHTRRGQARRLREQREHRGRAFESLSSRKIKYKMTASTDIYLSYPTPPRARGQHNSRVHTRVGQQPLALPPCKSKSWEPLRQTHEKNKKNLLALVLKIHSGERGRRLPRSNWCTWWKRNVARGITNNTIVLLNTSA